MHYIAFEKQTDIFVTIPRLNYMTQRIRHSITLIFSALILFAGTGNLWAHVLCNHCSITSHFDAAETPSCCTHSNSAESPKAQHAHADNCICFNQADEAVFGAVDKVTPPAPLADSINWVACYTLLFKALVSTEHKPEPFIPLDTCIASGRDILSLHAVLLI